MEVTKLYLNGNDYNIKDVEAHSKVNEIIENTYTKEEVDANFQTKGNYLKVDGSNGNNAGVSTLLRKLTEGDQVMTDNTMVVTSYYSGQSNDQPLFYRRPATLLWNYIKGKADNVYLTEHQSLEDYVSKEEASQTYQPKGSYLTTANYSSYALPLSGGTMSGDIRITNIRGSGTDTNFLIGNNGKSASATGVSDDSWFVGNYAKSGVIRSNGDLKHYNNTGNKTTTILDSGNFSKFNIPTIWTGSENEYQALSTKDNNTLYLITE